MMKRTQQGFTIIETLVAVAILMIAIAGPLVVAHKALTAALYAKNQSIASFLAQEGVELIRHVEDNISYICPNPAIFGGCPGGYTERSFDVFVRGLATCTESAPCYLRFTADEALGQYEGSTPCTTIDCPLYEDSGVQGNVMGYTPASSNRTKTMFDRFFYVTPITGNPDEYRVTVVVTWNEGAVANDVTLRSEMTAIVL